MKSGDKECVVGRVICPARTVESSAEGAERLYEDTGYIGKGGNIYFPTYPRFR